MPNMFLRNTLDMLTRSDKSTKNLLSNTRWLIANNQETVWTFKNGKSNRMCGPTYSYSSDTRRSTILQLRKTPHLNDKSVLHILHELTHALNTSTTPVCWRWATRPGRQLLVDQDAAVLIAFWFLTLRFCVFWHSFSTHPRLMNGFSHCIFTLYWHIESVTRTCNLLASASDLASSHGQQRSLRLLTSRQPYGIFLNCRIVDRFVPLEDEHVDLGWYEKSEDTWAILSKSTFGAPYIRFGLLFLKVYVVSCLFAMGHRVHEVFSAPRTPITRQVQYGHAEGSPETHLRRVCQIRWLVCTEVQKTFVLRSHSSYQTISGGNPDFLVFELERLFLNLKVKYEEESLTMWTRTHRLRSA